MVTSQWYETFGMIVIEAFGSGVPVIVGDIDNVGLLIIELTESNSNMIHLNH